MSRTRSVVLLEVLVALALLTGLGVALLRVQTAAIRQVRVAEQRAHVVRLVEELLWAWSSSRTPVTLPATGELDEQLQWRREVRPVRIATGVLPMQVSLIVTETGPGAPPREIYRVDWLVPPREQSEADRP